MVYFDTMKLNAKFMRIVSRYSNWKHNWSSQKMVWKKKLNRICKWILIVICFALFVSQVSINPFKIYEHCYCFMSFPFQHTFHLRSIQ